MGQKEAWYSSMRKRLNTDDEGVRAYMKELRTKSDMTNSGFARMKKDDPERLKKISKEAIEKRWQSKNERPSPN